MKISSHCYAITGLGFIPPWSVNAGLVNGQTEILVIDTGGNQLAAQTIYGYASALEQKGKLRVINTEHHLDHIGGNSFFREKGIDIYGHYQIRRSDEDLSLTIEEYNQCIQSHARRERNEARIFFENTYIVNPNIPIDSDTILNLGDLEVKVILTPGHTSTNISVYVPSDGVLFCGDCVLSSYLPNLESGTIRDWETWIQSLSKLRSLDLETIVPGHGNILHRPEIDYAFKWTQNFLEEAISIGRPPTFTKK